MYQERYFLLVKYLLQFISIFVNSQSQIQINSIPSIQFNSHFVLSLQKFKSIQTKSTSRSMQSQFRFQAKSSKPIHNSIQFQFDFAANFIPHFKNISIRLHMKFNSSPSQAQYNPIQLRFSSPQFNPNSLDTNPIRFQCTSISNPIQPKCKFYNAGLQPFYISNWKMELPMAFIAQWQSVSPVN